MYKKNIAVLHITRRRRNKRESCAVCVRACVSLCLCSVAFVCAIRIQKPKRKIWSAEKKKIKKKKLKLKSSRKRKNERKKNELHIVTLNPNGLRKPLFPRVVFYKRTAFTVEGKSSFQT